MFINHAMAIRKYPEIPIFTTRKIIKKFKTTGAVMYLPGREHKCILPTSTVRVMLPESKISPRITVGELQKLVVSWGHQVSNNYN